VACRALTYFCTGMKHWTFVCLFTVTIAICSVRASAPTAQDESDVPSSYTPNTETFDYVKRTAMIPMRDGVKLYTVILIPRSAVHAPILLTRTPYPGWQQGQRERWDGFTDWIKWVSSGSYWLTQPTMSTGKGKPSTSCWQKSRSQFPSCLSIA
jgi:hypothetical protein